MANVPLLEEVNALKNLGEEYERQLNLLGMEFDDLSDECRALIDKCIEVQCDTNLNDIDITYLAEFYYNQKQEDIENYVKISKLNIEIEKLKKLVASAEETISSLEKFTAEVKKRVSVIEMERKKLEIEKEIAGISELQKNIAIPTDIDFDELLQQIESYDKSKKIKIS